MIRTESSKDIGDIRRLNGLVFSGPVEGSIVDAIRNRCPEALSLVAVEDDRIIGHIFFSPVSIDGVNGISTMGLGPMAVLPEYQRKGIGTALITRGVKELEKSGCAMIVVLGHEDYYPKFGFVSASQHDLKCQWEGIPDDAFMVKFLKKDKKGIISGTVRYMKEFDSTV